jgi:hypothetical protein
MAGGWRDGGGGGGGGGGGWLSESERNWTPRIVRCERAQPSQEVPFEMDAGRASDDINSSPGDWRKTGTHTRGGHRKPSRVPFAQLPREKQKQAPLRHGYGPSRSGRQRQRSEPGSLLVVSCGALFSGPPLVGRLWPVCLSVRPSVCPSVCLSVALGWRRASERGAGGNLGSLGGLRAAFGGRWWWWWWWVWPVLFFFFFFFFFFLLLLWDSICDLTMAIFLGCTSLRPGG